MSALFSYWQVFSNQFLLLGGFCSRWQLSSSHFVCYNFRKESAHLIGTDSKSWLSTALTPPVSCTAPGTRVHVWQPPCLLTTETNGSGEKGGAFLKEDTENLHWKKEQGWEDTRNNSPLTASDQEVLEPDFPNMHCMEHIEYSSIDAIFKAPWKVLFLKIMNRFCLL